MRSDGPLSMCGDPPHDQDGSEQQATQRFSHLLRSAGLATRGEKCRHLSRVWREMPDQWRIVERRLVRSGEFVSPHRANPLIPIRHVSRVWRKLPDRWRKIAW